ncbi:hypothetical protein, partial [Roseibium hamelinense]
MGGDRRLGRNPNIENEGSDVARASRLESILGSWSQNGRHFSRPLQVTFLLFLTLALFALTAQNIINEYRNLRAPVDKTVSSAQTLFLHQKSIAMAGLTRTISVLSGDPDLVSAMRAEDSARIELA